MTCSSKRGAILGVVVIVMLALSLIGVGMMSLGTTDSVETTRNSQRSRVFWIAEAGLNKTASRLVKESFFRDSISRNSANPYQATENYGDGGFAISVYRGPINTTDSNSFFITSIGSIRQESKVVSQTATINAEGYQMPFYSNAITANSAVFNAGVAVSNGPVSVPTNSVKAPGGGATFTLKTPPDPPPPLDTGEYDKLIGFAASTGSPATNGTINLAGGTVYIRGDFQLQSVTGPGTIIASGTVDFRQGSTVGSNVTIIAGDMLIFRQGSSVGSNGLLYASKEIQFDQGGVVIDNSALLTPGDIVASQSFDFRGIMYAGGDLKINNGGNITGIVVSGGIDVNAVVTMKSKVNITYNGGAFPNLPPPGLGGITLIRSQWREV